MNQERQERTAPTSSLGLRAWILSLILHAIVLALLLPLLVQTGRLPPTPVHWTISLVEPLEQGAEMPARPQAAVPALREDHTASVSSQSRMPQSLAPALQKQIAAPRPASRTIVEPPSPLAEPITTSDADHRLASLENRLLQTRPSVAVSPMEDTASRSAPAITEHSPPPLNAPLSADHAPVPEGSTDPTPVSDTSQLEQMEPPVRPAMHPIDSPAERDSATPLAPSVPVEPAVSPAASVDLPLTARSSVPTTEREADAQPVVAPGAAVADLKPSATGDQSRSGPDGAYSTPAALAPSASSPSAPADYGWLQRVVSRRLEELKRSARPSIHEPGRLRVLVKAVISSQGELMATEIVTSSGHHRLDQDALSLVQRAFPMVLERVLDRPRIVMRIPITYTRD